MTLRALWLACTALTVVAGPTVSQAADWNGSSSTNWFDLTNWSTNAVPTIADNVFVNTIGPNPTVISGAAAVSNVGRIATAGNSTGHVTVTGVGSSWANSDVLLVGEVGSGTLVIQHGGQVTNTGGSIGFNPGSTGQVLVDGAGSRWTNSRALGVSGFGTGTLLIRNGGLVINTSGVIGEAPGSTGQVTVDGAGASWINTAMSIGDTGAGTLTIRNGGTVIATGVSIASDAGAIGTLNIGAAAGATAVAPGTLSAPTVTFGNGAGQIVFNHTATSYIFAPLISGAGAVRVENGITNLTANSTYTGNTLVNGGTLLVNGSIAASPTTVNTGGTLGGGGVLGNTSISGGTLSPGNSIGTLTVQGSLTFTAASTYLIEVDPSGSDRTNVTGSATLGGATVSAIYANGSYVARRYTILNATGGVSGTFNTLVNTNLPASFAASLSHDANNAFLDLTLNFTPTSPNSPSGLNVNQTNVAGALVNSFSAAGGIPLAFGALTPLGLTQVSGEATTGTQQTTFDAMGQFTSMLLDPSLGERGGGLQGGASAYAGGANAYASIDKGKAPPIAAPFAQRWNVWAAGYGGTQSTDGNAVVGSNDVTSRIFGAAAGFDYRLSPQTLVGFSLGGAGTKYDLANGLGSGRSEMFQAGVYGRHDIGAAYIAGALAYGWQDVTTDRNVLLSSLRANFDTNAISGRLEAGYRVATGLVGLTPYAAGQFTTVFLPDYAEQVVAGANTFALSYAGKDVTASRSELGLRADRSFAARDAIVTLRGRAAWTHNFDTDRSIATSFQTLPVAGLVVNGAAPARDAALVSASAETKWLNGVSVAASFDGEFSNVTESYAGKGVVRYRW
jgi:T5SS/PEP-CTERM-associated repeat protein/autotransporter-associated beta strand protein